MPRSKAQRTRRQRKRDRLPQMTTAIPRLPDSQMDGKTFVFNQFIPIQFPTPAILGETVSIWMNASPNGYDYQVSSPSSTPFTFSQLWGEAL
jgi:hypothetical protein